MRLLRLLTATALVLVALGFDSHAAAQQPAPDPAPIPTGEGPIIGGDGDGTVGNPEGGQSVTVDLEASLEIPAGGVSVPENIRLTDGAPFGASVPAGRPHPVAETSTLTPPCGDYLYFELDADYNLILWEPPKCLEPLTCGSERVDDVYFGRISGDTDPVGVYADYLNEIVGSAATAPGGVTDVDVDATNTSLLAAGLGPTADPLALATFRWCRNAAGEFDRTDPVWGVSFSWDTTFDVEYDRDVILDGLFDTVRTQLTAYDPDVATAPPLSVGHTYVKFPTWLWINDPVETVIASSEQDLGHIQASLRATLTTVVFDFGDGSLECDPSELVAYVDGITDPIDDVGPCHRVFDTVTDFDLAATLTYAVEQRISTRSYSTQPWIHGSWEPHTTNPVIETISSSVNYEVHELLSLNVNQELELASD